MVCRERVLRGGWILVLGTAGCWPVYMTFPAEESGTGSSGGVVTTGGTGGTSGAASGTSGAVWTTGAVVPGSSGMGEGSNGSSSGGQTFIIPTDVSQGFLECDPWMPECPPGEKCAWYASEGGTWWDATRCVPQMEDPAGIDEECFVVDNGVSGIDNCEAGALCWDTNAENIGYCVALCTGSPEAPMCMPGYVCAVGRTLSFCIKYCDPLAQDCPEADDLCIGNPSGEGFLCVLDASGEEGQVHDPCEYANSCDSGLLCLNTDAAVECDKAASGCCQPFCDLTAPNACPGQGQLCKPYHEMDDAPVEYEKVGVCALP